MTFTANRHPGYGLVFDIRIRRPYGRIHISYGKRRLDGRRGRLRVHRIRYCTCGGIRVVAYPGGPDIKPVSHFSWCAMERA